MPTPRSRQAARLRARRRRAQQRARRIVLLGVIGALGVATLLLTAFGSGSSSGGADPAVLDATPTADASAVRPRPEVLATVGNLHVQLPVAAASVTGIGFHGARDGALSLRPVGRQANEGLLARLWRRIVGAPNDGPHWYQLDGPAGTEVLDVGAAPGTDVYAPVDGSIVSVSDVLVDGAVVGARIDVRPSTAPSVMVSLTHVRPDPSIAVGNPVQAAASKLGTVVDIAAVEEQALAEHARENGNNVAISVYPSPGSLP